MIVNARRGRASQVRRPLIAGRLRRFDLGIVAHPQLDMSRLDVEAVRADTIIQRAAVNGVGAAR